MLSEHLLQSAADAYGFDATTLRFISATANVVYWFRQDGQAYILRCAQRPATCLPWVAAEMDWLAHLATHGISVSLPLRSRVGDYVVTVQDEGRSYLLTAFTMAGGHYWDKNDPARWNATVFHNWGRVMGEMHRLARDYVPPSPLRRRDSFAERETIPDKLRSCPTVYKVGKSLLREIVSLPTDRDAYGLIHYDLHPWNFLLEGERINVYDFDDCLYGWFALDIGVALYHGLWWGRRDDTKPVPHEYGPAIISHFLRGYLSANALHNEWLSRIPLFMRYRQICKFSWFYEPGKVDAEQEERIHNIKEGVLFTDFVLDEGLFCRQQP